MKVQREGKKGYGCGVLRREDGEERWRTDGPSRGRGRRRVFARIWN